MPDEIEEKKVSAIIQKWLKDNTELTMGEALCAIYRKYRMEWKDIPRERGKEICAYLKTVDAEKKAYVPAHDAKMKQFSRPAHFSDEL